MGFGPMGFGVAGVLGAKVAAPDRPCVSVCGDGAFMMHASVLATAVECDLPVVWVVWNNYAYASIRGLQRGYLGGRELATDFHHPKTGDRSYQCTPRVRVAIAICSNEAFSSTFSCPFEAAESGNTR